MTYSGCYIALYDLGTATGQDFFKVVTQWDIPYKIKTLVEV